MPNAWKGNVSGWAHWVLVAAIALMGLWLRVHNVHNESVYWDEFSSLVHLKPPAGYEESPHFSQWNYHVIREEAGSLLEFWKANRELDPATMPLYYTFEYFAWNYGGQSVLVLRLLSVLFGVLAFPFVYLLGRALWGPAAGAVALFLFAASPVHVQFAQDIRMYALFIFLASASAYTFYRVVQDGGRIMWLMHLVNNLFLLWVHPFAVWLPFVQGLFLIFFCWRRWRLVLAWGFAHVVLLLPSALYVSTIEFFSQETTDKWMVAPTWRLFWADVFADDFVGLTSQVWGRADTLLRFFDEGTAYHLANSQVRYNYWLAIAFVLLAGLCVAWQMFQLLRKHAAKEAYDRWKWALFLVMWALLPPLILYFLSTYWRPMIMPRYTLHCSLAFYLLAGGAVAALPWKLLRVVPVAFLILAYGYQQSLVYDGPHRTDWNGVARFLHENADEDDLILVENWLWKRVFTYTMGPAPQVISYATELDTLGEMARTWLDGAYPKDPENPEPRGLWIVYNNGYFNPLPADALGDALIRRGMGFDGYYFDGVEGVWVLHVSDDRGRPHANMSGWTPPQSFAKDWQDITFSLRTHEEYPTGVCFAERGLEWLPNDARLWSYLGQNLKQMQMVAPARDAFATAVKIAEAEYPWTLINLGECHLQLNEPEKAVAPLEKVRHMLPDDLHSRVLLGQALAESGRPWDAMELLQQDVATLPFVRDQEDTHWQMIKYVGQVWSRMAGAANAR